MPIFEYTCDKCRHVFEELQDVNSSKTMKCPVCGFEVSRSYSSRFSIVFKGEGFYCTDSTRKPRT